MTASSPVTMEDLVNGLNFFSEGSNWRVELIGAKFYLTNGNDPMNEVTLSSNGMTITFGGNVVEGPSYTGFTFNA